MCVYLSEVVSGGFKIRMQRSTRISTIVVKSANKRLMVKFSCLASELDQGENVIVKLHEFRMVNFKFLVNSR